MRELRNVQRLAGWLEAGTIGRRYNPCEDHWILRGLAWLTSCSAGDLLSDAQTWSDMHLPVATTPAPADGRGPAGGEIVQYFWIVFACDTVLFLD